MPKFKDGIRIILLDYETNILYRMIVLLFYLLGVYQVLFYQFEKPNTWGGRILDRVIRHAYFIPRIWHPLSVVEGIIFGILNMSRVFKIHNNVIVDVFGINAYIIKIE